MSEQFYRKKQLLVQRDQILESIGRTVYIAENLPPDFEDLPRAFDLKDTFVDQLRDRKAVLRKARQDVMSELDVLDRQMAALEREFEEKLGPCNKDRNQLLLRFEHAQDRIVQGGRKVEEYETEMEDLSCRIKALDLRISAGEKHRKSKLEDLEKEARPLRERLKMLNQNIGKTLREEAQLKAQLHQRLRDLGYFYFNHEREPEKFGGEYTKLRTLIDGLADYRTHVKSEEPEKTVQRDAPFWKWMMAVLGVAVAVMILFRTQYQQAEISFGHLADHFLTQPDDHRFFVDLNRAGLESWRSEVPPLESLPGGGVFSGIARQDILAYIEVVEQFREGELLFCGIKLRKTPARFSYRLVQQGWRRQATKLGYEALSKDRYLWLILTDREFVLLPRAALDKFPLQPEDGTGTIFRLEQKIAPFDQHLSLLQGLDQMVLEIDSATYRLSLIASQPLADAAMRRDWLNNQMKSRMDDTHIAFLEDRLTISGPYDPEKTPFQKGKLKAFVASLLDQNFRNPLPSRDQAQPKANSAASFTHIAAHFQQNRQGIAVYHHRQGKLQLTQTLPLGLEITDLVWLHQRGVVLVVDAGSRSIFQLAFVGERLEVSSQLWFESPEIRTFLGERKPPFVPGKLVPTKDESIAALLEGKPPKDGRSRILLIDLRTLTPVAIEELHPSIYLPLVAQWDAAGHDLYVGTQTGSRSSANVSRVLGYRREGHVLSWPRVISASTDDQQNSIAGLHYRNASQGLFLHQIPGQTVTRYQLNRGIWDEKESLQLDPEPQALAVSPLNGPSLVVSRTGDLALVLSGNSVDSEPSQPVIQLLDLVNVPMSVAMKLPLEGVPTTILRMPLSDRFWVGFPEERRLVPVVLKDRQLSLENDKILNLQSLAPQVLASDRWGDYLLVAGAFSKGFPMH